MSSKFCLIVAAGLAAGICSSVTKADITGFGNFSGFTINQADVGSAVTISPNTVQLTNVNFAQQEARSIWFNTPQSVSQFTASFSYQALNASAGGIFGASFVLQNSPSGLGAVGLSSGSLGYGGIGNSVAVSLELGASSRAGLYTGGVVGGGSAVTGSIDFGSGHWMNVLLSYNGSILQQTIVDTVTQETFSTNYVVNIPLQVGGSTAIVGLTASTGVGNNADQYFSNLQYSTVPTPAALPVLALGGMVGLSRRRRAR